jgi:hypothetical protein
MSVRSFEEDSEELVEKLAKDVAIDTEAEAEAEGVAINAEAVDEIVDDGDDPNNQDFLLSRDEDEADTDMGDTRGNRRHWRNMVWDKEERKFVFETDGFNPVADNAMPKLDQWKTVYPQDMTEAKVTFNEGRETMLQHLIEEYNAFTKRLDDLGVPKNREGLFEFLYGERSRLAISLTKVLDIEYKELCHFLGTMYFAARFGCSFKRLKDDEDVNTNGLMDSKRYNEIWRKIGLTGKNLL